MSGITNHAIVNFFDTEENEDIKKCTLEYFLQISSIVLLTFILLWRKIIISDILF